MGNQGFQGEARWETRGFRARQRAPGSVSFVPGKEQSYYLYLYATKQVSDNENVHHR